MSPDIEWRVGEEADQETIAKTSSSRRSLRRRWVAIVAIGLGAGLGVLYRSIPEPPPKPIGAAPIPTVPASPLAPQPVSPLTTPEPLVAAIERDALRLASSAGEANHPITFADAEDKYADWYAALQNAYGAWGIPPSQALYTIAASDTLSAGTAWATVEQYRHGVTYRQTRFYRLENDRWVWTLPDRSFWSGVTTVVTVSAASLPDLIFRYPIEDEAANDLVLARFVRAYQDLCASLQCPPNVRPDMTVSLTIKPMFMQPEVRARDATVFIDLPSPNVVGVFEKAPALGDAYLSMAYATLIDPVVRLASGDYARWETDSGGRLLLQAIATWQRARLPSDLYLLDMYFQSAFLPPSVDISPKGMLVPRREHYVNQLRGENLVPLVSLWDWPTDGHYFGLLEHVAVAEAQAVVVYIEERYGREGVVRFLNSLGKAQSLDEAIETALPTSFSEFNQRWQKWIAGE
jgi:hypothetical protein